MTINQTPPATNKNKWIWIGLGAALLFCCGAVLVATLVFWQAGKKIQEGMKTDPEAAAEAAHKIADYDLPEGYQEQVAMDIMFYSFVMIGPENSTGILNGPMFMLAQFQAGVNQEQMEEQLRQSFEQQAGNRGLNMSLVNVEEKTIRGEETQVATYEGSDENGHVFRQVITSFPGKDGVAMLMIMGPVESWDQDLVDAFIESIR
ncbi:MAG TPA: hypothetical protein VFR47_02595 [Anaerolineales bacterium]|nr:hypothetical protein [Anaerolineales bacterium]